MIGHYLLSLTPEQEDRLLTRSMGALTSQRGTPGCLLQVATDTVIAGVVTFDVRQEQVIIRVGYRYDRLRFRFGAGRLAAAIRNRILSNRARRVLTYTLASEPGSSLKAAGWMPKGLTGGGSWSRPSRPRVDTAPLGQKQLWEAPA